MTPRTPRDTTPTCSGCGWSGKTTTAGFAAYALRRHRCSREQIRRDVAARAAARRAADGPRRDCHHPIARHQHGTHTAYVLDKCRCRPCRDGNCVYERNRQRQAIYGRWRPYVDAEPARQHVRDLAAAGMGLKRVVLVSGVAHGTLWKLVYGKRAADGSRNPSKRIRRETEAALLAIQATPESLAGGAQVDNVGVHRRLQALVAIGWSQAKLAARLGILDTNLAPIIYNRRRVSMATVRAVAALYEELWDQRPPETNQHERISAARSRNRAAVLGWLPPMAWDDDTIDQLAVAPTDVEDDTRGVDEVAVLRRAGGDRTVRLTRPERWLLVQRLHAEGLNDQAIHRRTGISDRQVLRDRQALGLPAITTEARTA